jgi:hypothetical protein
VEKKYHLPHAGRLSTVTASILFGYALLPFMRVPAGQIAFPLFGILVAFRLNFYYVISVITALMVAAGMDWIIADHPSMEAKPHLPHLIMPALTTAAIGIPLGLLELGLAWWVILALGSLLVVLVMLAEYISIDNLDSRYPLALMVLSGTSYSLMLIITIALRAADVRLYLLLLVLPSIFAFFCLRILNFRLGGRWRFEWTAVIALVAAQVLAALYYWPLPAVRFGLITLGPVYALTGLAASLEEKPDIRQVFLEPLAVMGSLWLLAVFIR